MRGASRASDGLGRRSRAKSDGAELAAGKTPTVMLVNLARMLGEATVAPVPESHWGCQGDPRVRRRR